MSVDIQNRLFIQVQNDGLDKTVFFKSPIEKIGEAIKKEDDAIILNTLGYGKNDEENIIRNKRNSDIIEYHKLPQAPKYDFTNFEEYLTTPSFLVSKVDPDVKQSAELRQSIQGNNIGLSQELELLKTISGNQYLQSLPVAKRLQEFDRMVKKGYRGNRDANQRIVATQDGIRSFVRTRDRFKERDMPRYSR